MLRKYHNHTLQTNPRHREEAAESHRTFTVIGDILFKTIAKIEWTQSNA